MKIFKIVQDDLSIAASPQNLALFLEALGIQCKQERECRVQSV